MTAAIQRSRASISTQQFETLTYPRSLRADEISGIRGQTRRG
jgi:hypothetical protein